MEVERSWRVLESSSVGGIRLTCGTLFVSMGWRSHRAPRQESSAASDVYRSQVPGVGAPEAVDAPEASAPEAGAPEAGDAPEAGAAQGGGPEAGPGPDGCPFSPLRSHRIPLNFVVRRLCA